MILEQRHNPQPATGPSLPRAYDPHSTFSITNGPIIQPRSTHNNHNANANGSAPIAQPQPPIRPTEPFRSFAAANLVYYAGEADVNADPGDIWFTLEKAWHELGPAGQRPYEKVYEDQMREYQAEKDEYDRGRRRGAAARGAGAGGAGAGVGANGRDREREREREGRGMGAAQGGSRADERGRADGEREREGAGRRGGEDVEMDGAPGTAGGFTAVNG